MNNLDMVLDEYAKRGILDGNAVARIYYAAKRDAEAANGGKRARHEMNGEVMGWLHNVRRGIQCGRLGSKACEACTGVHHCVSVRNVLRAIINASRVRGNGSGNGGAE